jgi:hypothetical protein
MGWWWVVVEVVVGVIWPADRERIWVNQKTDATAVSDTVIGCRFF